MNAAEVTLPEHILQFGLRNDRQGIARDIVVGEGLGGGDADRYVLRARLHQQGRRDLRWSLARHGDPDMIYMAVYDMEDPPTATSYTTWWAPGLDAAQLEIYVQLRSDGTTPTVAATCAQELGEPPC